MTPLVSQRPGRTRRRTAIAAVALAALAGCIASPERPREADQTLAFRADHDYEGAYRRVLEQARRCWPATAATGQRQIDGTLDQANTSGRVTLAFRSRDGLDTRLRVDLKAADRTHTDVRIEGGRPQSVAAVRGWLDGSSGDCP